MWQLRYLPYNPRGDLVGEVKLSHAVSTGQVDEWTRFGEKLLDSVPTLHDELKLLPLGGCVGARQRDHLDAVLANCTTLGYVLADIVVAGNDEPASLSDIRQPLGIRSGRSGDRARWASTTMDHCAGVPREGDVVA